MKDLWSVQSSCRAIQPYISRFALSLQKGRMYETDIQQISQKIQRSKAPVRRILEQPEAVAQEVSESIQAVARTAD